MCFISHLFTVLHPCRYRGLINFLMISLRAAGLQISNPSTRDAIYVTWTSSWDCARAQSKRITDVKHNSVTLTIISTENWTSYCGVLDLVSVSNKKFQNKCYRHKYLTSAKQLPRVLLPSWSINVLFNFKEAPPFSTRPLWGVSPMSEDLRMNGIWWLRHLWRQKSGSAYFLVTRVSYKTTLEGKRAQNYMSYTQVSSTFFLDLSSCFNFSSPHITHISQMSCSLPQV